MFNLKCMTAIVFCLNAVDGVNAMLQPGQSVVSESCSKTLDRAHIARQRAYEKLDALEDVRFVREFYLSQRVRGTTINRMFEYEKAGRMGYASAMEMTSSQVRETLLSNVLCTVNKLFTGGRLRNVDMLKRLTSNVLGDELLLDNGSSDNELAAIQKQFSTLIQNTPVQLQVERCAPRVDRSLVLKGTEFMSLENIIGLQKRCAAFGMALPEYMQVAMHLNYYRTIAEVNAAKALCILYPSRYGKYASCTTLPQLEMKDWDKTLSADTSEQKGLRYIILGCMIRMNSCLLDASKVKWKLINILARKAEEAAKLHFSGSIIPDRSAEGIDDLIEEYYVLQDRCEDLRSWFDFLLFLYQHENGLRENWEGELTDSQRDILEKWGTNKELCKTSIEGILGGAYSSACKSVQKFGLGKYGAVIDEIKVNPVFLNQVLKNQDDFIEDVIKDISFKMEHLANIGASLDHCREVLVRNFADGKAADKNLILSLIGGSGDDDVRNAILHNLSSVMSILVERENQRFVQIEKDFINNPKCIEDDNVRFLKANSLAVLFDNGFGVDFRNRIQNVPDLINNLKGLAATSTVPYFYAREQAILGVTVMHCALLEDLKKNIQPGVNIPEQLQRFSCVMRNYVGTIRMAETSGASLSFAAMLIAQNDNVLSPMIERGRQFTLNGLKDMIQSSDRVPGFLVGTRAFSEVVEEGLCPAGKNVYRAYNRYRHTPLALQADKKKSSPALRFLQEPDDELQKDDEE